MDAIIVQKIFVFFSSLASFATAFIWLRVIRLDYKTSCRNRMILYGLGSIIYICIGLIWMLGIVGILIIPGANCPNSVTGPMPYSYYLRPFLPFALMVPGLITLQRRRIHTL